MTERQKPRFVEILMNAEIGAYQEDNGNDRPERPLAERVNAKKGSTATARADRPPDRQR